MLVRKLKLVPDDFPNVILIGINTTLKDYRLAYFINKDADLKLERYDDLPIFNEKIKAYRNFSFYSCYDADQRVHFYLYGNDSPSGKMIEQYSQANFFLLIKGKKSEFEIKTLLNTLRRINSVTFIFIPVISKIKELDGIMQDLELHEMSQFQRINQAL